MSRRIIALVASAALLGGCAQLPGTAASVNGERISEGQVADAAVTFEKLLGSTPNAGALVDFLVKERVVTPVAAEYGLTASDAQVVEFLGQYATGAEPLAAEEVSPAAVQVGRYLYLMGAAQQSDDVEELSADLLAAFQGADIEVSERYGTYSENGELAAVAHPWLETLAAAE